MWVNLILNAIIVICFIYSVWIQKRKLDALAVTISSLETTISAQEKALTAMEKVANMIDVDKLGKYVKEFEKLVEKNSKLKLEILTKEFTGRIDEFETSLKQKQVESLKPIIEHYLEFIRFALRLLHYIHPEDRARLLDELKHQENIELVTDYLKKIEAVWSPSLGVVTPGAFLMMSSLRPLERKLK